MTNKEEERDMTNTIRSKQMYEKCEHVLMDHYVDAATSKHELQDRETEVTRRLADVMISEVAKQQHRAPDLRDNPERAESRQGQGMQLMCVTKHKTGSG